MSRSASSAATSAGRTRVDEPGVPLGAEAGAALVGRASTSAGSSCRSSAIVIFHGWRARISSLIQAMNDQPSGSADAGFAGLAVDASGCRRVAVEAQAVAAELLEPGQRAVAQERADLAAAVVRPGRAPGRVGALVVVEVDPAAVALGPAVEPPQVEVRRAEVVVDDVDDHGDPVRVGVADEPLERVRPAVAGLDREQVRRVVAPRDVAGELERRHHLDGATRRARAR